MRLAGACIGCLLDTAAAKRLATVDQSVFVRLAGACSGCMLNTKSPGSRQGDAVAVPGGP